MLMTFSEGGVKSRVCLDFNIVQYCLHLGVKWRELVWRLVTKQRWRDWTDITKKWSMSMSMYNWPVCLFWCCGAHDHILKFNVWQFRFPSLLDAQSGERMNLSLIIQFVIV